MSTFSKRIKIGDKVYTKDVTAFLVDGTWLPKKEAVIDNFTQKYSKKETLTEVLDLENNLSIYTSAPVNLYLNGNTFKVCKSFIQNNDEFILDPNFSSKNNNYISIFDKNIRGNRKYSPGTKIYSIATYDKKLTPYKNIPNPLDFITYTFGFETETSSGELNCDYTASMGFANIYDGSITGVEYVSNPMTSRNFHYLHNFLATAKVATNIDKFCSLHIHIGNVPKSDEYLLSLYTLFQRLTDELNQLIVPYKKDVKFLMDKLNTAGRDHCKNLPKLAEKNVESIYKLFRISGLAKDQLEKYITGTNKWNVEGRYYSVNFMNYICKDENNTVEIRSLQSTYNFDYIITWLLINTSIIDFAVKNHRKVLDNKEKIELSDCLEAYIDDKEILNICLRNILILKNYYYNNYYYDNNTLLDLKQVESYLDRNLISYNLYPVPKTSIENSKFNLIKNKKIKRVASAVSSDIPQYFNIQNYTFRDVNQNILTTSGLAGSGAITRSRLTLDIPSAGTYSLVNRNSENISRVYVLKEGDNYSFKVVGECMGQGFSAVSEYSNDSLAHYAGGTSSLSLPILFDSREFSTPNSNVRMYTTRVLQNVVYAFARILRNNVSNNFPLYQNEDDFIFSRYIITNHILSEFIIDDRQYFDNARLYSNVRYMTF